MRISDETFRDLVAEARCAPSVHNIQPSRWCWAGERIQLLGDRTRAIPVADPSGRDWRLSHGAHFEGLALASQRVGLQLTDVRLKEDAAGNHLPVIAECVFTPASSGSFDDEPVRARQSWRGAFRTAGENVNCALDTLAKREDCLLATDRNSIASIASLGDRAALHFLRDERHRVELLEWMRLSRKHPDYFRDGLNAEAMQMSAYEAWGAGLVLGRLFRLLDAIGLAAPLLKEASKTASAAAIVILHRPVGEDAFHSGRAFYRAWLAFERLGLKGCPMSVLADWDESRASLAGTFGVPHGREIVSVFRLGVPLGQSGAARSRLPVDELIVPSITSA